MIYRGPEHKRWCMALWWNKKFNFHWNKSKENTRILLAYINSRLQNKSWRNFIFFFSLPEVELLKFLLFGLLKIGKQTQWDTCVSYFDKAVEIFPNDILENKAFYMAWRISKKNSKVKMQKNSKNYIWHKVLVHASCGQILIHACWDNRI